MADPAEQKIEAIRVELDSFTATGGDPWPENRWVVGKPKKNEHDRPPRVEWVEIGGAIQTTTTGEGGIGSDACRYDVTIWHTSVENCRATLHNLYTATQSVMGAANMIFGAYSFVPEANLHDGRKLKLQVTLTITVSGEVAPTVEIASHDHEVTVGGEAVC